MQLRHRVLAGVMAAALPLSVAGITYEEGTKLRAYLDPANIWTICNGQIQGIKQGDTVTPQQCRAMTTSQAVYYQDVVFAALDEAPSPERLAGLTVFSWNVGTGAFLKSTLLRRLNANDPTACDSLRAWHRVGKRDCRLEKNRKNGCYGLIARRERERLACMGGWPAEWGPKP